MFNDATDNSTNSSDWINPYQRATGIRSFARTALPPSLLFFAPFFFEFPVSWKSLIGCILFAFGTYFQYNYKKKNDELVADLEMQQSLNTYIQILQPLFDRLTILANDPQSTTTAKEEISRILEIGQHVLRDPDIRLSVYRLEHSEISRKETGKGLSDNNHDCTEEYGLTLFTVHGRFDPPRPSFEPDGSESNMKAIRGAQGRTSYVIQNCDQNNKLVDTPQTARYKSFAAFPLHSNKIGSQGVLYVDIGKVNFWTVDHRTIGELLAKIIVTIFEQGRKQDRIHNRLGRLSTAANTLEEDES
jgi:hypothetical protein